MEPTTSASRGNKNDSLGLSSEQFLDMFGFELLEKNYVHSQFKEAYDVMETTVQTEFASPVKCHCSPIKEGSKDICLGAECPNRKNEVECGLDCGFNGAKEIFMCQNNGLRKGVVRKLKLASNGKAGFGVVACEEIQKGKFIAEYKGVYYKRNQNPHHLTTTYAMTVLWGRAKNNEVIIEATLMGNIGRYIQHSHSPNCEGIPMRVGNEIRMGFYAIKDIPRRTFITYSYGSRQNELGIKVCACSRLESCPDLYLHHQDLPTPPYTDELDCIPCSSTSEVIKGDTVEKEKLQKRNGKNSNNKEDSTNFDLDINMTPVDKSNVNIVPAQRITSGERESSPDICSATAMAMYALKNKTSGNKDSLQTDEGPSPTSTDASTSMPTPAATTSPIAEVTNIPTSIIRTQGHSTTTKSKITTRRSNRVSCKIRDASLTVKHHETCSEDNVEIARKNHSKRSTPSSSSPGPRSNPEPDLNATTEEKRATINKLMKLAKDSQKITATGTDKQQGRPRNITTNCAYCSKEFKYIKEYKRHLEAHLQPKDFMCEVPECDFAGNNKKALLEHKKQKHTPKEQRMQYICRTCKHAFTKGGDLNKHMRNTKCPVRRWKVLKPNGKWEYGRNKEPGSPSSNDDNKIDDSNAESGTEDTANAVSNGKRKIITKVRVVKRQRVMQPLNNYPSSEDDNKLTSESE